MISVIIPVYNGEKYIGNILDDLKEQSNSELEIIVINDGSSDQTEMIVKKHQEKDSRIIYIYQENQGVSVARNVGIEKATGQFIRFLDADDRIPKDSMKYMAEPMERDSDLQLVLGAFRSIPERNLYYGEQLQEGKLTIQELAQDFVKYYRSYYYGVNWNKLYRADVIKENNLRFTPKLFWCEDFIFNLAYYKKCNYIYRLPTDRSVYDYISREDSISSVMEKSEVEMGTEINKERERLAGEFFDSFGLGHLHQMLQDYAYLHFNISEIAKNKQHKKIKEVYADFTQEFAGEDVKEYIQWQCEHAENKNFWYRLLKATEKQNYKSLFVRFYLRGRAAKMFGWLKPLKQRFSIAGKGKVL